MCTLNSVLWSRKPYYNTEGSSTHVGVAILRVGELNLVEVSDGEDWQRPLEN